MVRIARKRSTLGKLIDSIERTEGAKVVSTGKLAQGSDQYRCRLSDGRRATVFTRSHHDREPK